MQIPEFFPDGVFGEPMDSIYRSWYGSFLSSMGEKPLYPPAEVSSVYRFLLLPTSDKPLLVKVSANETGWSVASKTNDGLGGYDLGPRTTQGEHVLTPSECEKLLLAFDTLNFWSLPINVDSIGFDGSQWVLEGVSSGRYHVVHRWSPNGGDFAQFCELLLDLGGLA